MISSALPRGSDAVGGLLGSTTIACICRSPYPPYHADSSRRDACHSLLVFVPHSIGWTRCLPAVEGSTCLTRILLRPVLRRIDAHVGSYHE
eukprot:scaffold2318_cov396-Prasinococcus_capsulatus_cf.AAC.3